MKRLAVVLLAVGAVGAASALLLRASGPVERRLAGYGTPLGDRSAAQIHNARLAAAAVNGRVVQPGEVFSFNRAVRSWTGDRGYLKAPVSFDGRVIDAWGGGVCQVSTTLYNAGLLAGLAVVERHHHHWPPKYVPAGRDAAVAYPGLDLRLRNPYPWPVTIKARVVGDRLEAAVWGAGPIAPVAVYSRVLQVLPPQVVRDPGWRGGPQLRRRGAPGCRVRVWRTRGGVESLVSEDYYPPLSQVTSGEG